MRDDVAAQQRAWLALLEQLADEAKELGELSPDADPAQVAFELNTVLAANSSLMLQGKPAVLDRVREAVRQRLTI